MCLQVSERNRQTAVEVDKIFTARKQREAETAQLDNQIETLYRSIQARINDLEPGKLRAYNDLMEKQRDLNERAIASENRLNEINMKIKHYESDEKNNAYRKEYTTLERSLVGLQKTADSLREELDIANLEPKDAHAKFVTRVHEHKQNTQALADRIEATRGEVDRLEKTLSEIDVPVEEDPGEAAKYELLQKRDQDMTAFMDKFDESRSSVLDEQRVCKETIVALLEHISQGLDVSSNLPSREALTEMKDNKSFKEKNLATAERTMTSLQV